ncbi:MAG TPA: fructosamine kinase family protein [Agriterribacter sp.]|nr:fructosamine kinase family protein [Agriterribacter sp.]
MLPATLLVHLEQRFSDFFSSPISIRGYESVYGGDINKCFKIETSGGIFFIKVNAALFGLDMFEKEARGLMKLADTRSVVVPAPLFDGKFNQQIFLVMEYINPGHPALDFWQNFGTHLAKLHYSGAEQFGLEYDNYIGKLTQRNHQSNDWNVFFAEERILPLVHKAHERGLLETDQVHAVVQICSRLNEIFPAESPALLHGDLWNGNFVPGGNGQAAIFDPAIYYGHREMDIAMTLLFGGFDAVFYEAYQHHFPLQPGWEKRVALCQLYPLLVHLLLFGGNYRQKVEEVIAQYR